MTSIFRRRDRKGWTVKYKKAGRWRRRQFPSEWKADQFAKLVKAGGGGPAPTLLEWSDRWLKAIEQTHRPGTASTYRWALTKHVLPALGSVPLDELTRAHVKEFLLDCLRAGLARRSVNGIRRALSTCLSTALDDGLLLVNVAKEQARALRLHGPKTAEPPRSFTQDEARVFIEAVAKHEPEWLLYFRLLILTGLRGGESLALTWDDIDWNGARLYVRRGWVRGKMQPTKTGRERVVDLPAVLLEELRARDAMTKAAALRRGEKRSAYLFSHRDGHPHQIQLPQAVFKRALAKAGLPGHFTPHSLRHTFARLHLEAGASLKYVAAMLGHRNIGMTADLYGAWADMGSRSAAETLAGKLGVVTISETTLLKTVANLRDESS